MPVRLTPAALAVAVLVGGVLVGGCGSVAGERTRVAAYVNHVNRVESALAVPLAAVSKVATDFVAGRVSLPASQERALVRDRAEIRGLGRRLAAIAAPRPARHLRALLLALSRGQLGMTRELAKLVVFLPRLEAALRPLGPATARLERVLLEQQAAGIAGVAAVFAAKATALREFRARIESILPLLRRLTPPAVSMPAYRTELSALEGMSSSALALAVALGAGGRANVAQPLRAFDRAAGSDRSVAAQNAETAAVRGYDARRAMLTTLTQEIDVERARLARTVP